MTSDAPTVIEHEIQVPLDHGDPSSTTVPLFARELVAPGGEALPYLVFLQGGPGGEPPRPHLQPLSPGWLGRALRDFRVLLLDQRGTGRSAPLVDLAELTPAQQADHLALFRADAIVADAELLREHLGIERWSLLGQSFGGFCTFTYLSHAPQSLAAAYLTGGVPPVGHGPEVVYERTYATMAARSRAYWQRYPDDLPRYRRLLDLAADGELLLPDGDAVTVERLRQVGHSLGMSYGRWDLHSLLERDPRSPWLPGRPARRDVVQRDQPALRPPPGGLLRRRHHDGLGGRAHPARGVRRPDAVLRRAPVPDHVHRGRRPVGVRRGRGAARAAPVAAPVRRVGAGDERRAGRRSGLRHDAYVDRQLGEQTLAEVPGIEAWLTDAHEHDGLRTSGAEVLDRLFSMVPAPLTSPGLSRGGTAPGQPSSERSTSTPADSPHTTSRAVRTRARGTR